MKINYKKLRVLITILFLGQYVYLLNAQSIDRTAVIPCSQISDLDIISFGDDNILPVQAIASVDVNLKLSVLSNTLVNKTCILSIKNNDKEDNDKNKIIGQYSLNQLNSEGTDIYIPLSKEANLVNKIKKNDTLNFKLEYKGNCQVGDKRVINIVGSRDSVNKQPKLIIDYKMEYPRKDLNWTQSLGNAQHTNSYEWTLGYDAKSNLKAGSDYTYASKDGTLIKEYISIFRTNPITFSRKDDYGTIVKLWPSNATWNSTVKQSWQPIWEITIPFTSPKQQPIITPEGKMLYFSGIQKYENLIVLDLQNGGELLESRNTKGIDISQNIDLSQTSNTITMGYDGSLYAPLFNGVAALSSYPSLRPKWVYENPSNFGPVSLNALEHIACFIEVEDREAGKLVLVDNLNGTVLCTTGYELGMYTYNNKEYAIPPVVIQSINDKSFHVLVPNKKQNADVIYIYKVNYTRAKNKVKSSATIELLKMLKSGDSNQELGFAQILVTNNEAHLFDQENCVLNLYSTNDTLVKSESLDCDRKGEFYFGTYGNKVHQANVRLYDIFKYSNLSKSHLDILSIHKGFGKSVYSPDGSFYSIVEGPDNDKNMGKWLYRFYPTEMKDVNTSKLALYDIGNLVTHGHNKEIMIAKQTINNTQSAIFYSPRITFKPGVRIQKGAFLSFKTLSN